LPDTTGGSDLDLCVPLEHRAAAKKAVLAALDRAGGVLIGCADSPFFFQLTMFGRLGQLPWWGACVDVYLGLRYTGLAYANLERTFEAVIDRRGIPVVKSSVGAVIAAAKELLHNGVLPEKYHTEAAQALRDDPSRVDTLLEPLGAKGRQAFRSAVRGHTDDQQLRQCAGAMRRSLVAHATAMAPVQAFAARCAHVWGKWKRWRSPSGAVIAILGVDGVGKSTVIRQILPVLETATHRGVVTRHLRPHVLPPLSRLRGQKAGTDAGVLDPHGSAPAGVLGSAVRMLYYGADYVIGYWMRVRPAIAKRPCIWLFDRYAFDMGLDPQRFRIGLNARIPTLWARLLPKPDLCICLHAPPGSILGRKAELPAGEIERQLRAIRELATREPRAMLVSTEGPPEVVRDRVLSAMAKFFASRTRRLPELPCVRR
jgi:thymidylate kinase